jgi:putative transposase
MTPPAHSHSLRTGRHSQAGQIYMLTTVTRERLPLLAPFDAARCVFRSLQQAQNLKQADTLAFVVMPDHLH